MRLTGAHWAIITISSVKYLAFKTIAAGDETILSGLDVGRKIEIFADGGTTVLRTLTIAGAYNTTQ